MWYAKGARMMTEDNHPKDVTLRGLLDETHRSISQAVEDGEYSTVVIIRCFVPRDVRKEYKRKMKKELGYRLFCDWDDRVSLIIIRW